MSESERFRDLAKKLVNVPKEEIDAEAKKYDRKKKSRLGGKRFPSKTSARDRT